MPSNPQSLTTQIVFDYIYDTSGKAVVGAKVTSTLNLAGASDTSPIVNIGPLQQTTTTDNNGYWQFNLIPNPALTPTGTSYTIESPYNSYSISVPNSAGPFQSSSILVNVPSVISPAVTGLTGPITVTGNETVTGNLTVQGTTTLGSTTTGALSATSNSGINGDLTVFSPGRLLFTSLASKIVPGATSISHRNNADSADNLLISDAGNLTARGTLALSANPGSITMQGVGTASIVGGTTGLNIANNANNANNVAVTDAGLITLRNALSIPAVAGGSLPPSSYGSLALKYDEQTPGGVTSITIPASGTLPNTFRQLIIEVEGRGDTAATSVSVAVSFNGDNTAANYNVSRISGNNNLVSSAQAVGTGPFGLVIVPAASATANFAGSGTIVVPSYARTSFFKTARSDCFFAASATAAGIGQEIRAMQWSNTAAITTVTLTMSAGNWLTGSIVRTYLVP